MNSIIEYIYNIDHTLLLFIQENLRFEILTPFMRAVSFSVNLGLLWVTLSVVLIFFKKTRMIGVISLSALAIGLLVNNIVLKNLVDRARPYDNYHDLIPLIPKPSDSSFASGHTTASFAAAGVFVRFFNKPLAVLVIVYAVLVGLSRLYLGVHYPTDVICGCLIGITASLAAYAIYDKKFDLKKKTIKQELEIRS